MLKASKKKMKTYEDIHNHNYGGAVISGAETIINGTETVIDGIDGNWL